MCGIIGYIGRKAIVPLLMDGLKRLEYRGYDSAGIAILTDSSRGNGKGLFIHKKKGKIRDLEMSLDAIPPSPCSLVNVGIGHTRWATHGRPNDQNAHPHRDCTGKIAVVHNGIIENYASLKRKLIAEGHRFQSETDTEVIAHLIESALNGDLMNAVMFALEEIEGSYAVGVISLEDPETLIAARKGRPLVIGCGQGESFIASDVPAILPHTKKVIYLNDGEIAAIQSDRIEISLFHSAGLFSLTSQRIPSPSSACSLLPSLALEDRIHEVTWDSSVAEKGGYKHFMLKEIYEQPRAIRDTHGRYVARGKDGIHFDEMGVRPEELERVQKIYIVACGTSYHAALVGKWMLEKDVRVSVEADIASEFRYRVPVFPSNCLMVAISQSGETADTLAAMRQARKCGSKILSICNVVGSSVTRESDGVIYTHAGPEIGVASTKAFTTQVVTLYLFSIYLAGLKGTLSPDRIRERIEVLQSVPEKVESILHQNAEIRSLASLFHERKDFLYLGRSLAFPIAMEGALKLKEISYVHAEGYPAGEMKHGPIALINEEMPVVALVPKSNTYDKMLSNIEEVKARGGTVIAIATEGDLHIQEMVDHVLYIPEVPEEIAGLLMTVPLQLLAYHIADLRGCEIDQPRNLAKSVTVE